MKTPVMSNRPQPGLQKLVLMILLVMLTLPTHALVLFEETFRNYRDRTAVCTDETDIRIANDPIWSRRAEAICGMKQEGYVFREYRPIRRNARGEGPTAFDFDFQFRFLSERLEGFDVRLRFGPSEPADLIVSLSPTGATVRGTGRFVSLRSSGPFKRPISPNEWRRVIGKVENGNLNLWLEDNRLFDPVLQCSLPAGTFSLEGLNFYGHREVPFALTAIQVRDSAPLPDFRLPGRLPLSQPFEEVSFVSGKEQPSVFVDPSDRFGLVFRTGTDPDGVILNLEWADGTTGRVAFAVGSTKRDQQEFPEALVTVRGLPNGPRSFHIRPLLRRYHSSYSVTEAYRDIVRDWDLLPKASFKPIRAEFRRDPDGLALYLNGRFADRWNKGIPRRLQVALSPSAAAGGAFSEKIPYDTGRFLALDLDALGRARAFFDAKLSLSKGLKTVRGVPILVTDGRGSADVGLVAEGQGNWALEVDEYLARSPFDGFLSEIHFSVPAAPYRRAWVLCALDPDPAKDNVLTVRLARYFEHGSGNNLLADTVMILPRPGEKTDSPFLQEVGKVSLGGSGKEKRDVPLYLAEVPLRSGHLLDLIAEEAALNFEFLGRTGPNWQQIDNRSKPDPSSISGVQIFGVTLERSPLAMKVIQSQPGNIFGGNETPRMSVLLSAHEPAAGLLEQRVWNDRGEPLGSSSSPIPFRFEKRGDEKTVVLELPAPAVGWYEMVLTLRDEKGDPLIEHPARYAVLAPDERRAGYESPFGVWWFDGAHRTPSDPAFAGPILLKAGIRKVGWTGRTEAELAAWRLTKDQVKMPFSFRDLATPEERASDPDAPEKKWAAAVQQANETMAAHLQKYPHLREVLIFHESGPGNDVPMELLGLEPVWNEAQRARQVRYAELFNRAGAYFRQNFPALKTVVGNNSCSASTMAAIFRHGGKVDYLDYIGIEAPSQAFIPEKLQEWALQGQHIARDIVRMLTGRDVPATGCYEFTYRCERDIGEQQQAEWYIRDVLIGLAHGFTRVGPGILFDCANAYYNSLWGASGLLQRGPYGYPKRSYVAYAALTAVLDQVRFNRQIETGSGTIYAVEFRRADGRLATALWCARGEADLELEWDRSLSLETVDFYGRKQKRETEGNRLTFSTSTSATYLLADHPLKSIRIMNRRFPRDEARAQKAVSLALKSENEELRLVPDRSLDTPLEYPLQLPIRQAGSFRCERVIDEERGVCWEITLEGPPPRSSRYVTEYGFFRLAEPVKAAGEPAAIGVWVKGNSGWGRVWFEIEDAEGEVWRSVGTGGWGCDILDWPGQVSINFDGWNFVALPLRESGLFEDRSPGPILEQWVSGGGDKVIQYPIRLRGIGVEMTREALDLRDFKPVKPVIRLQELGVLGT